MNTTAPPTTDTLNDLRYVAKLIDDYVLTHTEHICTCDQFHNVEAHGHDPLCLLGFNPVTIASIAIEALQRIGNNPLRLVPGP